MEAIHARLSIGISELKVNPGYAIEHADGPVAALRSPSGRRNPTENQPV